MLKQKVSSIFRKIGLMHQVDNARYLYAKFKNYGKNQSFKREYPNIKLPPDYLIYESFQMDYGKYYLDGRDTANWLLDHCSRHIEIEHCRILDWGCGPGRIIRHLPDLVTNSNTILATDYNAKSIKWCTENIEGVEFSVNGINPPLTYEDESINLLYAISIFTHLSLLNHVSWMNELYRIANKKSCFFITCHGDAYREVLTVSESEIFAKDEIVIRDKAVEGHRVFGAFQPPKAFRKIIEEAGFKVKEHIEGKKRRAGHIEQDIWLISK